MTRPVWLLVRVQSQRARAEAASFSSNDRLFKVNLRWVLYLRLVAVRCYQRQGRPLEVGQLQPPAPDSLSLRERHLELDIRCSGGLPRRLRVPAARARKGQRGPQAVSARVGRNPGWSFSSHTRCGSDCKAVSRPAAVETEGIVRFEVSLRFELSLDKRLRFLPAVAVGPEWRVPDSPLYPPAAANGRPM